MKKIFCLVVIFFLSFGFSFGENTIYFAKITDTTGDVNLVSELKFLYYPAGWYTTTSVYYFKVMKGESSLEIPFSKIKLVEVIGNEPIRNGYPALITFSSGEKVRILLNSGTIDGKTEFTDGFSLDISKTKTIEFLHDGRFKKCPTCNTLFYNSKLEKCKFCGDKLEDK